MYLSSQVYLVVSMRFSQRRSDAGELRSAALAVPLGRSVERPALAALEGLGRPGAGLAGSRSLASRRRRLRTAPAGRARRPGVARGSRSAPAAGGGPGRGGAAPRGRARRPRAGAGRPGAGPGRGPGGARRRRAGARPPAGRPAPRAAPARELEITHGPPEVDEL